jgi:thymidylate synthase ThyX
MRERGACGGEAEMAEPPASLPKSVEYPVETFSAEERARLEPHVTNLDEPVFALVNLPETVKGALFARYSRYPGTLRRMFLDEFAGSLPSTGTRYDGEEGARAADLYERIFVGYGDDSVAQLGGAHVACEWVSNVLTKVLQRPRLGAYLEQSTRYIAYDAPIEGTSRYRYYRDPELGPGYEAAMDEIFGIYSAALPRVQAWAAEQYPAIAGASPRAHERAIRAKALDLLRGLLPAASLSHMGIFATGQTYEQLILHLLAHPLPEARHYGRLILTAVQDVMPSFVSRVERPDRGGEWVTYLERRERAAERWVARLGLDRAPGDDGAGGPSVRLTHHDGDEDLLLSALLFEAAATDERTTRAALADLTDDERGALLADLVGERANRRHRPGRGLESLRYRFEIVSDYGAFRDLQRHRMLTCQWQALTPDLGAGVPHEVDDAGVGEDYRRALEVSRNAYERLLTDGHDRRAAMYALCLGYRLRYVLDLNAREAMQLIELRSGREGHPAYRAVAHAMHERIAAVHPAVAAAMTHLDRDTEPRLERIVSELRTQAKLDARC